MHRVLARQLRRLGIDPAEAGALCREQLSSLLERVSQSYVEADQERYLLERSLDIASREMRELYEAQQQATEARYQDLFETTSDLLVTVDPLGELTSVNAACEVLTGFRRDELIGSSWMRLIAPESVPLAEAMLARQLAGDDGELRYELDLMTTDGRRLPVELSSRLLWREEKPSEMIGIARDISERRAHERRLRHMAQHDALTDLPNRTVMEHELATAVARAKRGTPSAVALIDIDHFKMVNDTLGHQAGDQLLVTVASLLRTLMPDELSVRLSGDEFAVLMRDRDLDEALILAERFREALEHADLPVAHDLWYLSASIGVTEVDGQCPATELLARADSAMYAAKGQGRNRVVWAGSVADQEQGGGAEGHRIASLVRRAISSGGMEIQYQPIVELQDSTVRFYEALVRLRGDDGELLSPGTFLPAVERFGLMSALDGYVARAALERLRADPDLSLFINVSPLSLADPQLFADLTSALMTEPDLGPRLGVEITETAALRDVAMARQWIGELRAAGCRVAIDDFGTGFNSLTLVRDLPVTEIKIDRSFVESLATEPRQRAVIGAIQALADGLGVSTVAEGIETDEQLQLVKALGVTYGQGYLLGRPAALTRDQQELAA